MAVRPDFIKMLTHLEIHSFGLNEPVEVEDTADNNIATRMLNEFKNYGTMHLEEPAEEGEPSAVSSFPYHTVKYIKMTSHMMEIDERDPYGCK